MFQPKINKSGELSEKFTTLEIGKILNPITLVRSHRKNSCRETSQFWLKPKISCVRKI